MSKAKTAKDLKSYLGIFYFKLKGEVDEDDLSFEKIPKVLEAEGCSDIKPLGRSKSSGMYRASFKCPPGHTNHLTRVFKNHGDINNTIFRNS